MKNTLVLEMLNNGELELLKKMLEEEIYKDSINKNGNAKSRYNAMKRYFKYVNKNAMGNKALMMPCKDVKLNEETYNSFVDSYCVVLTKESIDTLENIYDNSKNDYFDVSRLFNFENVKSKELINLGGIIAEAKTKGYKYSKHNLENVNEFALRYKDAYFNLCLVDKAFAIIDDGDPAEVMYTGSKGLMYIKTSVGFAGVLPFRTTKTTDVAKVVIEI